MIRQTSTGLNSRSEANPFGKDGFLPLITSPMYSVVNESNYQVFLDNKIQVCLPRTTKLSTKKVTENNMWFSFNIDNFKNLYCRPNNLMSEKTVLHKVCIDTANGNIPVLHDAIRKAKEIHGDSLIIMAGNVSSVKAFIELAKTGVDYIRVGIGGGGGCNTTSNTGVGQENLEVLIKDCLEQKELYKQYCIDTYLPYRDFSKKHGFVSTDLKQNWANISSVKIVADGISSYIKQCETKYGFNDNGYAAINKLLFAGADLVMIGKLFAECIESAGEKGIKDLYGVKSYDAWNTERLSRKLFVMPELKTPLDYFNLNKNKKLLSYSDLVVKYSGMSTQQEQEKYKNYFQQEALEAFLLITYKNTETLEKNGWVLIENGLNSKESVWRKNNIKPSEGSVNWIPVRWTLNEWLNGSENQDSYPYLMGWVNSIKSVMAYTGKTRLHND